MLLPITLTHKNGAVRGSLFEACRDSYLLNPVASDLVEPHRYPQRRCRVAAAVRCAENGVVSIDPLCWKKRLQQEHDIHWSDGIGRSNTANGPRGIPSN